MIIFGRSQSELCKHISVYSHGLKWKNKKWQQPRKKSIGEEECINNVRVETDGEEPKASCIFFHRETFMWKLKKTTAVDCSPFRFSLSDSPLPVHYYPRPLPTKPKVALVYILFHPCRLYSGAMPASSCPQRHCAMFHSLKSVSLSVRTSAEQQNPATPSFLHNKAQGGGSLSNSSVSAPLHLLMQCPFINLV